MYKIYINDTPLCLADCREKGLQVPGSAESPVLRYHGRSKQLLQVIDKLEKPHSLESLTLCTEGPDRLFGDFAGLFSLVEAAGGLVRDPAGRLLVIFRRGYWDLPKGKIDPGESPQEAAIREVREETGLRALSIAGLTGLTWHTYRLDRQRILKKTWWYDMRTEEQELLPQMEEDITRAIWVRPDTWLKEKKERMYRSLEDFLSAYLANRPD